jgi:hypothetical protein
MQSQQKATIHPLMGFRFRKRIKLFPGLWINLSKKGGSVSVGGHGATTNISKDGVRGTVGLPGTGLSYQTKRVKPSRRISSGSRPALNPAAIVAIIVIASIVVWILAHAIR